MSAHATPAQIRSNLSHPIVDGDGHWLEYTPVFSEKMRKAGGNKAADAEREREAAEWVENLAGDIANEPGTNESG